jgi:AI-2 transport protein TqsA
LITSSATGALVWMVLTFLGLDMAFLFAVLVFMLNFIPTLGSIIATILPIPVALIQFESPWRILLVILIPAAIQFVVGNLIDPKLLGDRLDLHPVVIVAALLFWGLIWGLPGMFLAVPITVAIRLALLRSELGREAAELMAGRLQPAPRE